MPRLNTLKVEMGTYIIPNFASIFGEALLFRAP